MYPGQSGRKNNRHENLVDSDPDTIGLALAICSKSNCIPAFTVFICVGLHMYSTFNPLASEKIGTDSRIRPGDTSINAFQLKPIHWLIHGLNCTRYILQSRTNQFVGIKFQNLPSIQARAKKLKSQFHLKATPMAYGSQRVKGAIQRLAHAHCALTYHFADPVMNLSILPWACVLTSLSTASLRRLEYSPLLA